MSVFASGVREVVSPAVAVLLLELLVPLELEFVSEPFSAGAS